MLSTNEVILRPYRGRDDLAGMADVINARVAEEGEGEHATVASLAEQYDHLQRCDPATDIVVAEDAHGVIVGYARVFWDDVSEGYRAYYIAFEALSTVEGLGGRMLDWGIERATAIAAGHDHPDRRLEVWANDGGPRQSVVAAAGFAPFSWSAYMVRPHLRDIPDRPLPDGLTIRPVAKEESASSLGGRHRGVSRSSRVRRAERDRLGALRRPSGAGHRPVAGRLGRGRRCRPGEDVRQRG